MASSPPNVRVGVAAVICNEDGQVILGRRKGSTGAGQWAFPGGHLEFGESFFNCAERETLEETGLIVQAFKLLAATNSVFDSDHHYVTLFVQCKRQDPGAQPQVLEPEKCHCWTWETWDKLKSMRMRAPEDLFLPIRNLLDGDFIFDGPSQCDRISGAMK